MLWVKLAQYLQGFGSFSQNMVKKLLLHFSDPLCGISRLLVFTIGALVIGLAFHFKRQLAIKDVL